MGRAVLKEVETGATVVALPGAKPGVVPLPAPARKPLSSRLLPWLRAILVNVLPPLVTVALIALFWQIAASGPQSSLPPPTKIWEEAKDLIVEPFYWAGSQDIGLGWRILVSLQRVAIGFSVTTCTPSAAASIACSGCNPLGVHSATTSGLVAATIASRSAKPGTPRVAGCCSRTAWSVSHRPTSSRSSG